MPDTGTVTLHEPVLPCALSTTMEENVANTELMAVVEQTCNTWFFKLSEVFTYYLLFPVCMTYE